MHKLMQKVVQDPKLYRLFLFVTTLLLAMSMDHSGFYKVAVGFVYILSAVSLVCVIASVRDYLDTPPAPPAEEEKEP